MTSSATWPWPHFSFSEMSCPCCGAYSCKPELLDSLETLRAACGGLPLPISSGFRCPAHNKEVGGLPNSVHVQGLAADILADGTAKYKILRHVHDVGFTGIGVASWGLHLDLMQGSPRPNVWTY